MIPNYPTALAALRAGRADAIEHGEIPEPKVVGDDAGEQRRRASLLPGSRDRQLAVVLLQIVVVVEHERVAVLIPRLRDGLRPESSSEIPARAKKVRIQSDEIGVCVPGIACGHPSASKAVVRLPELHTPIDLPYAAPITLARGVEGGCAGLRHAAPQQHVVVVLDADAAAHEVREQLRRIEQLLCFLAPGTVAVEVDDALEGVAGALALGGALPGEARVV